MAYRVEIWHEKTDIADNMQILNMPLHHCANDWKVTLETFNGYLVFLKINHHLQY